MIELEPSILDKVMHDIKFDEGIRLKPYHDSKGKLTIGYGRNLDDVGISSNEALMLLTNDIEHVVSRLDGLIPWWRNLNEIRQRVVINMMFNLGPGKFMGFRKALAAMENGNFEEAAKQILDSLAARELPERYGRLAKMMRDGTG
jgi:lysozyme